jgi:hypothetical protein
MSYVVVVVGAQLPMLPIGERGSLLGVRQN